jgi:colanic acid biosynthesis glycosyl transferase WcaI
MQKARKVVVVSQHYPPDQSTTAGIMAEIANHLALKAPVAVLSGWPGSAATGGCDGPEVIEISNRPPDKAALFRRAVAEARFTLRTFLALLRKLKHDDVVLTVTAPFMLPYGVVAAARLKRARAIVILHDLFPDVLVTTGLLKSSSLAAKTIRALNGAMFHALAVVVVIGRDSERLLSRYRGLTREKICLIPNWATLVPGVRQVAANNRFRCGIAARSVVGLSGNLGFTHDPVIVFEAARLLSSEPNIHFLLSGWGMGFERLKAMQSEARLANVTLIERVPDSELETLLSAADVWLIPYRKDVAGLSVPSRLYNLLAVGRPLIVVSEPQAEAALIVSGHRLGSVVPPGAPRLLAEAIRSACRDRDPSTGERAVSVARNYDRERALISYWLVVQQLFRSSVRERAS